MNREYNVFIFFIIAVLGYISALKSQTNIVPNGGFEKVDFPPIGWYYIGEDFTKTVKYWYSPTTSSPDFYGPDVIVPSSWKEKGFGNTRPYRGDGMAGITVFGCSKGKAHCREYLAVELEEPLVPKQNYKLSFYAKHLPKSRYVKSLGAAVVGGQINLPKDTLLHLKPILQLDKLSLEIDYKWTKIEGTFKVLSPKNQLIIGNFLDDDSSENISSINDLGYGYYYIDEVKLIKVPPYLPVPQIDEEILKLGQPIYIRGLHFNTDRYALDANARMILDKVAIQMLKDEKLCIEIHGHTDAQGTSAYNDTLAYKRATAVFQYLQNKGIPTANMRLFSHGESQPVDSNQTETGRYQNRRVEIIPINKAVFSTLESN